MSDAVYGISKRMHSGAKSLVFSLPRTQLCLCLALLLGSLYPCALDADEVPALNERVLVVFDSLSPDSKNVATHYMSSRGIPRSNLCRIRAGGPALGSLAESVVASDFEGVIKRPIRMCLDRIGREKILYIVFSYGTPYKLKAIPPQRDTAIDQQVADIWDQAGSSSPVRNPYFAGARTLLASDRPFVSLADYRRAPGSKLIYSVWRIDGATPTLARGLVDKALAAEKSGLGGQACIDRRFGLIDAVEDKDYGAGDWALFRAAEFLRHAGIQVTEDSNSAEFGTPPAPLSCDHAAFYAGWYSLNHYNDAFVWAPGAIGLHLDSDSAIDPRGGRNWSANAIIKGITITAGSVGEPFLPGLPRPDGIVHDLLAGANVGDAFLRNTAPLKWMILNFGDPLYRPHFVTLSKEYTH